MTKIYTAQMHVGRLLKNSDKITFIDTTVRSADVEWQGRITPTWDMVRGSKGGTLSNHDYTLKYLAILERSKSTIIDNFNRILGQKTEDHDIALGCYCSTGSFCHRHLLSRWMEANIDQFKLSGELTKANDVDAPDGHIRLKVTIRGSEKLFMDNLYSWGISNVR